MLTRQARPLGEPGEAIGAPPIASKLQEAVVVHRHRSVWFAVAVLVGCSGAGAQQLGYVGPREPFVGGGGGNLFDRKCPDAQGYVTGITIRTGAWVDAVRPDCSAFDVKARTLSGSRSSPDFAGGPGGGPQSASCYPAEYLAGIKVGFTRDGNKPKFLDYVELICRPIDGAGETRRCLQTGNGCWDKHPDPGPYNGYGLAFESRCESVFPVQGIRGRANRYVDAIGVMCGPSPFLTPNPGPTGILK